MPKSIESLANTLPRLEPQHASPEDSALAFRHQGEQHIVTSDGRWQVFTENGKTRPPNEEDIHRLRVAVNQMPPSGARTEMMEILDYFLGMEKL